MKGDAEGEGIQGGGIPEPDVRIVDGPLRPLPFVPAGEGAGAVLRFLGVVRPLEDGTPIVGLRYETYDPMAERMLAALASRLLATHGLHAIRVRHSRGFVANGACSFQLDVASPHRREAMEAVDAFITQMKEEVPIWKHAVSRVDGSPESALGDPREALQGLLDALSPVGVEAVPLSEAAGRTLAMQVRADRDSPPVDVSAMDGFAVRGEDLEASFLPVRGEAAIGESVPTLTPGSAMRIFTGGPVPLGADRVVRREDVEASTPGEAGDAGTIRILVDPSTLPAGQFIRRRGENGRAGDVVLEAGTPITAPVLGAMGAFGIAEATVHRRVDVALVVTGDELAGVDEDPGPTGIRDSNGWALLGLLERLPWVRIVSRVRVDDAPERIRAALDHALASADAVLVTGGVSMGDHDHVPGLVRAAGARVQFHRLAIKPGKPVLGAVGSDGQLVLGLPGNPVSVLATAVRFALPALRLLGGRDPQLEPATTLRLEAPGLRPHPLTRFVPVRVVAVGEGTTVSTRGSGDLVGVAGSDGLVEVPPGEAGPGPYPYFPWEA